MVMVCRMERLQSSECQQSYLDLHMCLEKGERSFAKCVDLQKKFRECVKEHL